MTIGMIGAGKMAEAIAEALRRQAGVAPHNLLFSDVSAERLQRMQERFGAQVRPDNRSVAREADVLFLAIKPQQLDAVLEEIAPSCEGRLVISIAAGKRLAGMQSRLPAARVIRVMPNICCLAGEAMSVMTCGPSVTDEDRARTRALLEACGRVLELPENQFDGVTALSGSGPAFFAYVLEQMAEAATEEGLAPEDALTLAAQTMRGTAELLLRSLFTPLSLREAVTSAKGTTAAGRAVLETPPVAAALRAAIRAAARRSRELSGA